MKKQINKATDSKFVVIILFMISISNCFGQNKVINSVYDLNDPRNPDCPCHKMQKQAEDEFSQEKNAVGFLKQLGESDEDFHYTEANDELASINSLTHRQMNKSESTQEIRRHRKSMSIGIHKQIFRFGSKHKRRRKTKPNYSVCYKW